MIASFQVTAVFLRNAERLLVSHALYLWHHARLSFCLRSQDNSEQEIRDIESSRGSHLHVITRPRSSGPHVPYVLGRDQATLADQTTSLDLPD